MVESPYPPQGPDGSARAAKDVKDLAGGALVNLVGKLGRVSRGAFLWVITVLCGWEVQGLYSLAWGIVSSLNKVARFGLQRGVIRGVVEADVAGGDAPERAVAAGMRLGLASSLVVGFVAFVAADALAAFYGKPIAGAIRVMAFSAPFMTWAWVFVAAIRARRVMRFSIYVMSIGGPLMLFVGGAAVGLAGGGLTGVAWVQLGMAVGVCLLAAYYVRRFVRLGRCLRLLPGRLPWRPLGRFSLPVMLTDLLYSLLTQLDVLMLGWFVEAKLMGIYAIARRVASVMLKAPQALDPIFSSIVSELAYHRRQEELGHRFVVISRWVLMVNLPVFAVLLLIGDRILPMFSKGSELGLADLETGFRILVILSVGMLAQGLFAIIEPLLAMAGRPQLNLYNNLFWIAANFGLNLWLIGRMGIEGAAWGATLSMTAVNALRLIEVRVFHRINPFQVSQLKPLAAAALAGCGAWGAASTVEGWVQIGVVLLAFLPLYVLGLWLLGLEAEDRALWRRLVRRLRRQRGPDAA